MLTEKEERFLRRARTGRKYFLGLAVFALGVGALYLGWAFRQMGSDQPCAPERWFDPAARLACTFSASSQKMYAELKPQTALEKSCLEALRISSKRADGFFVLFVRILFAWPVFMFGEQMLTSALAPRPYLRIIDKLQATLPSHLRRSEVG
jgi:hypothetical protein